VIFGDIKIIYHLQVNLNSLNYALEGYIHNFIVDKVDEKLQLPPGKNVQVTV